MSYESKYLKYKNKYLALKIEIEQMQKEDEGFNLSNFFNGSFFGGGKTSKKDEPVETLTSLSTTDDSKLPNDSESIDELFRQLGGAKKNSKKASKSKKSSKKASKPKAKAAKNFMDDSDIVDSSSVKESSSDDFSSSDLDW